MEQFSYRRIMVYGVTGSGKSTLASRLSEITGIPYHSVDDLTFGPNWVNIPNEEQRKIFTEICARDSWILDTAYGSWLDVALERVELVVGLDYPRGLSLARLFSRTVRRNIDGRPVCNGNRETWRNTFSKDSILIWHFKSFARKRDRIRKWKAEPSGFDLVHIQSPRQLAAWIGTLGEAGRIG